MQETQSSPLQHAPPLHVDWQQALQDAGFGIAVISGNDASLLAVNRTFAEMHGYDPSDMIGQRFDRFISSAPASRAGSHLCPDTVPNIFEAVHVRKDGTTFPVITDLVVPENGESRGGAFEQKVTRVGCFLDAAQLTHWDTSIRDSEERFRSLASALPQLIWASDAAGDIEYSNSLWRKYTGSGDDGQKAHRPVDRTVTSRGSPSLRGEVEGKSKIR